MPKQKVAQSKKQRNTEGKKAFLIDDLRLVYYNKKDTQVQLQAK